MEYSNFPENCAIAIDYLNAISHHAQPDKVPIRFEACEKVTNDLKYGGGFPCLFQFSHHKHLAIRDLCTLWL